jgi:hypothetical protein
MFCKLNWHRFSPAIFVTMALLATPVFADKPEGKGRGKGRGHEHAEQPAQSHHGKREHANAHSNYFAARHRMAVRTYFGAEERRGTCPPGLAKRHNGCMPPGQAKKWQVGKPLPSGAAFYDLPPALVVQIGVPPPGHKYVRVAADILLIAVGTSMVVDAIQDLGRL